MDEEPSIQRRLAAILAADIAGYSRLMHEDEPATVRDLKGFCRKVRFLGKIQKLGVRNSMTYRVPNARKSNFATEPSGRRGSSRWKRRPARRDGHPATYPLS